MVGQWWNNLIPNVAESKPEPESTKTEPILEEDVVVMIQEEEMVLVHKEFQEEPVQEEPVQEEPVQEEPVQEEPVQEEPVQEEPVQEESQPKFIEPECTVSAPSKPKSKKKQQKRK
jgi:penicillin-binding protein 1A